MNPHTHESLSYVLTEDEREALMEAFRDMTLPAHSESYFVRGDSTEYYGSMAFGDLTERQEFARQGSLWLSHNEPLAEWQYQMIGNGTAPTEGADLVWDFSPDDLLRNVTEFNDEGEGNA